MLTSMGYELNKEVKSLEPYKCSVQGSKDETQSLIDGFLGFKSNSMVLMFAYIVVKLN